MELPDEPELPDDPELDLPEEFPDADLAEADRLDAEVLGRADVPDLERADAADLRVAAELDPELARELVPDRFRFVLEGCFVLRVVVRLWVATIPFLGFGCVVQATPPGQPSVTFIWVAFGPLVDG